MFEVDRRARIARRELTVLLGIATIVALSLLTPSYAHASGCGDSWKNAESGSWFTGSNWSNGAPPTSEEEACITVNGTYTVTMTQNSGTVSVQSLTVGGSSGTQTLAVGSSCSVNAVLSTTAGLTTGGNGVVVLTNGDGCGDGVTLAGPIDNAGSILVEPEHGGARALQGNLTNTGTLKINASTSYNGASAAFTNEGAIDVAEGKQLAVSNKGSLTNGGNGSITGTGNGNVSMGSETSFTEGAGTTNGKEPVIVDDGSLTYNAGGGAGPISLRGSSSLSGSISAGQSLAVQSTCGENVVATVAAGFSNGGTVTLTNGDGCGDNATLTMPSGTLTNSGKLVTEVDHGGARTLQAGITNTGAIEIGANTAYNGAGAVLTNENSFSVGEGIQFTVTNSGSFTNGTGGSIASSTGDISMGSGTTFTEGAGSINGKKPVIIDDATLDYTGAGAGPISLRGSSKVSGTLAKEQVLSIESTCGENAVATAEGVTNGGTIALTNGDGCGDNATLSIPSGTLTNSGKISTEPEHGGARTIQGNLKNTGKLAINAPTTYNGVNALLINGGAVVLAEGRQLNLSSGASFTNAAGGKITANPSSDVFLTGGTFTEGQGTTAGTKPVFIDDGALDYTGEGESRIGIRGNSTLSGNVAAVQSLTLESTCSENALVTAAASYTNTGTITLTNGDGCGNSATLDTSAGTFTNSGTIIAQPEHGGSRTLDGDITNTNTITLNTSTSDPTKEAVVLNEGTINIANGVSFSLSSDATVTNGKGGVIAGSGSGALVQTTGTFNQAAGTTTGSQPVVLEGVALSYSEHGGGKIALRGASTLTGTIRAGETLALQSTCSANAVVTAAASFNNNGTLELTNGDGCGNSATLNLKGGTLTNNGTLLVANPHGGSREIEGNLVNNLILSLAAGQTLHLTGTYTQSAAGKLRVFIASAGNYGTLSVSGAASIAGTLTLRQVEPFKASLGQNYSVLNAASLTGTFATESEDQVNFTGLYYEPAYSATGVTLTVAQATQVRAPNSGTPGSSVTLSGSGYVPGDTITPAFTDSKGTKTLYPSVTVNSGGEFSTEITISPSAALGAGTINTTSTATGVHINNTFKVL
jgi:fibronectin-binding autotransporter adhesin